MSQVPETISTQVHDEEAAVVARLLANGHAESTRSYMSNGVDVYAGLEAALDEAVAATYRDVVNVPELTITPPPDHIKEMDLAVTTFPLARLVHAQPAAISNALAAALLEHRPAYIETVKANGPYVNIQLDRPRVYDSVLRDAISNGEHYGHSTLAQGQVVQVDYSSPNIAKKLGLQHAPTTIVGEALARINEAVGADVIRTNHLGDYGTPFGKVLVGIERYGDPLKLAADPVGHMHELYVRINKEAKTDPSLNDEARQAFARLEQGDPATVRLWEELRAANINENNKLYERLGIKFDTTVGESYFTESAQEIVEELLESGIAHQTEDGVVVVPAANAAGIPLVLRKSDGTTLYATRDLAALRYRMQAYGPDRIKYVVGAEQAGQLESMFTIAALAQIIPDRARVEHIKLGLLADKSGRKLSSRNGTTVTLEEVLDTASAAAARNLQERYASQPERLATIPKLAEALGIGAVAYSILRNDPASNTILGEETGATRDAGTAGYLQYTHARAGSVVRRSELKDHELLSAPLSFTSAEEWAVAQAIMAFPRSVIKAADTNGPHNIARALEAVAGKFSTLYQSSDAPILTAEGELRRSRVALARAVQIVLHNGLALLNIASPEQI